MTDEQDFTITIKDILPIMYLLCGLRKLRVLPPLAWSFITSDRDPVHPVPTSISRPFQHSINSLTEKLRENNTLAADIVYY